METEKLRKEIEEWIASATAICPDLRLRYYISQEGIFYIRAHIEMGRRAYTGWATVFQGRDTTTIGNDLLRWAIDHVGRPDMTPL